MTLGDFENAILTELQQPGAAFVTGGAAPTGPSWTSVTNPQFSQGLIDFWINEGYKKTMGDLEALEIYLVEYTFTSTAQTYKYSFPPTGYAAVSHIARIYYKPFGLPYTREFRPGTELLSWSDFQNRTGQGYLDPYSFGTQPQIATIDPLRQNIYFYPGSSRAGDTITVDYSPIPSPYYSSSGVQTAPTGCPILVNSTDTPVLPYDCHMAIYHYAMSRLWRRAREVQMAEVALNEYNSEIQLIKNKYTKRSHGDTIRVEAFGDQITIGGGGF